ncbi:M1 family metallopeptidase [Gracilimonas mengyeensis]|uniref:Peptidase family M1 n=1 Tax=Gracilimonas mengyeensis TaxID=1302730 RepID=A0A521CIM1_9BACT|nr:M1 family metallopeptidase [Gracilimonas mengyeensis]SMO59297.1 Peptidase family M1 [Gracilimonas mengyeensis]
MRNLFFLSLLVATLAACSAPKNTTSSNITKNNFEPQRPIPYPIEMPMNFEVALNNGTRTLSGVPGENYFTNTYTYKLDATLSPQDTMLYGKADITYTNNSPDTLNILVFELSQNLHKKGVPRKEFVEITGGMNIERVATADRELQKVNQYRLGYVIQGTHMLVIPGTEIVPGESIDLEIDWNFKIPQAGASGRMGYSRDNLFYLAYWFPHVSTYDDLQGWFADHFTGNAEFYHDFGDYDISITAPEQWLVMSTGEFLNADEVLSPAVLERYQQAGSSDEAITVVSPDDFGNATVSSDDSLLTWKFSAEKVRDVAFSATLESQWDAMRTPVGDMDGDGQTDYSRINAFWRSSAPLWEDAADFTAHSISYLSEYTNHPYPWPHMTSVEGAEIIGGGMEFPMMTIIGSYNRAGSQALYNVTAHEIAHMWIPMIVSTNERRFAWMDEGATTFHEAQARWDRYPDSFSRLDEFEPYLGLAGSSYEGEIMRWSDYHYPGPAYGVASYPKPGSVLIALQGVLGEELFTNAWLTFIDRWAYKHPTPLDMFNTFEDVSGRELDWFWRAWYYETWTLDQSIDSVTQDGDQATIVIRDLGKIPMPVDLTISYEDGTEKTHRIPVDTWLQGHREVSIQLDTPSPISEVVIDKEHYYPDVNRANNDWQN